MSALVLSLPFNVVTEPGVLRLIAGEDVRYTFRRAGIDGYGAALVERLRSPCAREEALRAADHRDAAALLDRLIGERIVVEVAAMRPRAYRVEVRGAAGLAERVREACVPREGAELVVLCQDTLDYEAALAFQREARRTASAWMWITEAPLARGFVSPVFSDDGGPCLGCLLAAFRRLSPAPELYDALASHVARGGELAPAGWDDAARRILASVAALKIEDASRADPPASSFALHVLERASLEVSAHPLAIDVDCAEHRA